MTLTSEGNEKYAKGRTVSFPTIFGHRDAGNTDCPGDGVYGKLAQIRTAVATRWRPQGARPDRDAADHRRRRVQADPLPRAADEVVGVARARC